MAPPPPHPPLSSSSSPIDDHRPPPPNAQNHHSLHTHPLSPKSSTSTSSSSNSHRSASPPPPSLLHLPLASTVPDPSPPSISIAVPSSSSASPPPIATAIPLSPQQLHSQFHPNSQFNHSQRLFSLHLSSSASSAAAAVAAAPPSVKAVSSNPPPPANIATPPSDRHSRDDFRHSRDDCWSEGATITLIDAWGNRYVELNRGNLKQKHWKDVADSVNRRSNGSKAIKTDVQCKNRLDTLKKKYKLEKSKIVTGGGPSKWLFFNRLDELIGPSKKPKKSTPSPLKPELSSPRHASASPLLVAASVSSLKRHLPPALDDAAQETKQQTAQVSPIQILPLHSNPNPSHLHRQAQQFQAQAQQHPVPSPPIQPQPPISMLYPPHAPPPSLPNHGAAASDTDTSSKSKDNAENLSADSSHNSGADAASPHGRGLKRKRSSCDNNNSTKLLAKAIIKFSEVYERIEISKHQQMIDLEKQRMEFTKDLELQRLQLLMQMQVELAKLKYSNKQCDTEHYL